MKKLWHSAKYKRFNQLRAAAQLTKQVRFASRIRRRRTNQQGVSAGDVSVRNQHPKFRFVVAPLTFSVVAAPTEMCRFVATLQDHFENRQPVFVDLRSVRTLDYDGITVLLSVMVQFKAHKIKFNGNYPDDPSARQHLMDSRFFEYLENRTFREQDSYSLTETDSILTHAERAVDSTLAMKLIEAASRTVWTEPRRCPGIQRVLIELMHNTNNHASLLREGEKHWWLSVKHFPEERRVAFSFVDYGVGIFENLRKKSPKKKSKLIFSKLAELFSRGESNRSLLEKIFIGELHRTASGKPYRGKGLPCIPEAFRMNRLSNLALLSNDVFFDAATDSYTQVHPPFRGTFVHWELRETNTSLPHVA